MAEEPLTPAQQMIVRLRCGVFTGGEPLSLGAIGGMLELFGFRKISRQRVHILYRKALDSMGQKSETCLTQKFASIQVASLYDMREGPSKNSIGRLKSYFFRKKITKKIQYAELMRSVDGDIPEHRQKLAEAYDELESCRAFYADFGIRRFGNRFKVCTQCPPAMAVRPMSDFYKYRSGIWQSVCRECNARICKEKQMRKKQA